MPESTYDDEALMAAESPKAGIFDEAINILAARKYQLQNDLDGQPSGDSYNALTARIANLESAQVELTNAQMEIKQ